MIDEDARGFARSHSAASVVLMAGFAAGFVSSALGWLSPLAAFLAGAAPVFLLATLALRQADDCPPPCPAPSGSPHAD